MAERSTPGRGRRRAALALLLGAAVGAVRAQPAAAGASVPRGGAGPRTGFDALVGGWSRTDGNYHIVVREVGPDGALQATYFNPNPLPFARAQARREGGAVHAQFVLEAGGYGGSTYELRLDADGSRLVGSFDQRVAQQRFAVQFLRR
jgi:hypothetical protein